MHKIKQRFSVIILWSISIFWVACTPVVSPSPEHIRYEIDSIPHRIVNGSEYDIRVLQPIQSYLWNEKIGWIPVIECRHCLFTDEFNEFLESTIVIPSKDERELSTGELSITCSMRKRCDHFVVRRYTIDEMPEHTFIIYSNEGLTGAPPQRQGKKFSISLSSTSPFHFTIHNNTDEEAYLFWKSRYREKKDIVTWGADSRLERKTEYGTWETYSHLLDLYKSGNGIKIPAYQKNDIDGTQAYPNYKELPSGEYRWAIIVAPYLETQQLIFSPLFNWDGEVATPLEE